MNLLAVINYEDPNQPGLAVPAGQFGLVRRAARGVTMDAEGGVYLMHAANEGYYKLPGGGVEAGESMETALHREMREETGFTVQVVAPVGRVVQYHQTESFLQDSHAYVVRVAGQPETPLLTDEEAAAGFRVVRFPDMEAAITALEELRHNADWHSMLNRELVILRAAQQLEVVA